MLLDNATHARNRVDHHADWGAAAARIVRTVRDAFEVLAGIQYAAPWKTAAQPSAAVISSASSAAQPSGSAASRS